MNIIKTALSLCALILLSACLGSNDDEPIDEEPSSLRVIHASSDAPTVNVLANGEVLGFLVGVDYQQASEKFPLETGASYDFTIQTNTTEGAIEALSISLTPEAAVSYDVIAVGSVADDTLELFSLSTLDEDLTEGNVRTRVVHVAEDAPTVDVYITAVNADLVSAQPIVTLGYKDSSGTLEVEGGEYQIRITLAGSTRVAFDSGPVALPADSELLVLATSNVSTGDAPVSLVVTDGNTSSIILDKDTPASIRVVHGVADAPSVDIIANNAIEIFGDASYTSVTDYADVVASDYLIDVAASADNSVVVIDDAALTLEAGQRYTAIANNELANIDLDLIVDTPRRIATDAQIRLFHAASSVADVDIYITADGNINDVTPNLSDIPYQTGELAETGYVTLKEGDYIISITPANTKTVVLETEILSLQANQIYTAFVVNGETSDAAPVLIVADDF